MMQSIEHAAGSIKRVVAFRLKPGMDVLKVNKLLPNR